MASSRPEVTLVATGGSAYGRSRQTPPYDERSPAVTTTAPAPVTRYYELVDANDVDGLVALFTPDATYERPGYEPMRGHSGLTAFYSGERIIASGAHTLTHTVVDGDEVAVQGRFAGTARDGRVLDLRFADFFRLDGERIAYRTTYFYAPLA